MSNAALLQPYSAEEYLRNEETSAAKHEYVDGEAYAMAGAGERHNRIALNAAFHFRAAARGTPCGVFIADMKLRIVEENSFYYPDVMLTCQTDDDHPLYKVAPCIIVEALSPSTANIDRREKWHAYRDLKSLRAYLMVDSEQRRVDYYLRNADDAWTVGQLDASDVITLECGRLHIPLSLDDLYEDVDLPA